MEREAVSGAYETQTLCPFSEPLDCLPPWWHHHLPPTADTLPRSPSMVFTSHILSLICTKSQFHFWNLNEIIHHEAWTWLSGSLWVPGDTAQDAAEWFLHRVNLDHWAAGDGENQEETIFSSFLPSVQYTEAWIFLVTFPGDILVEQSAVFFMAWKICTPWWCFTSYNFSWFWSYFLFPHP